MGKLSEFLLVVAVLIIINFNPLKVSFFKGETKNTTDSSFLARVALDRMDWQRVGILGDSSKWN